MSEARPILYTCARSRGLRATWAAEEAEVEIDLKILPMPPRYHAPDYLKINPLGTVPMLVDGDVSMTESCAIAQYLAVKGDNDDLLVSAQETDFAAFLDYMHHGDATLTFPQTVFIRYAVFEKHKGWEDAGKDYAAWFHARLVKIEKRLGTREYLCADRFTIADICVGYALILAGMIQLDEGIPASLIDYRTRLTQRSAYKRALAREKAGVP